jgi:hypothetical protein
LREGAFITLGLEMTLWLSGPDASSAFYGVEGKVADAAEMSPFDSLKLLMLLVWRGEIEGITEKRREPDDVVATVLRVLELADVAADA